MTPAHIKHLVAILMDAENLMIDKYAAGQKEHGGNLWDMSENDLLDNCIKEAIDQLHYLLTLKGKRRVI